MTESERRNLFTYATKELSQDAFLMWLFNNYDDEDVGPVVYALLREFCGLKGEKICSLETKAQWHNIDISVWFETNDGKKHALFIEDKTDSGEHNQLTEYNKHIAPLKDEGFIVCKVYYKPGYVYEDERERVKTSEWGEPYDEDKIYALFQPFANSPNPIVRMYIEHIFARKKALSVTDKPQKNQNAVDFLEWLTFFSKIVIKGLEKEFDKNVVQLGTWRAGQYPYICLVARYKGKENVPYLEIQSRDCTDANFKARILCYGMDIAFIPQQKELIERIKASELFECKNLHYRKKGKDIIPKQIGYTKEGALRADTTEEFIEAVKKSVEEYLKLMEDWDKL